MAKRSRKQRVGGGLSSLHIKKNTAGTSNELSLSVLDNLKEEAEAGGTPASLNVVSIGSPEAAGIPSAIEVGKGAKAAKPGAKTQGATKERKTKKEKAHERAIADPESEVKRRKRHRRIRIAIIVMLLLALAGAGVYYLVVTIQNAIETKETNMSILEESMAELEIADETILAMDRLVTEGVSDGSIEEIEGLWDKVDQAHFHINAAESLAQRAYEELGEGSDRIAAGKVTESVVARRNLLYYADILLQAEYNAKKSVVAINHCWELVLQADELIKQSAALVTDTTKENTRASQSMSEEARDLLKQARDALDESQGYYACDMSTLRAFIDKRIECMDHAIASDEAIYLQDRPTAEKYNELYNAADAEAVALAQQLPADPASPIIEAFELNTASARENYLKARTEAGESDAFIRDYLRQGSQ